MSELDCPHPADFRDSEGQCERCLDWVGLVTEQSPRDESFAALHDVGWYGLSPEQQDDLMERGWHPGPNGGCCRRIGRYNVGYCGTDGYCPKCWSDRSKLQEANDTLHNATIPGWVALYDEATQARLAAEEVVAAAQALIDLFPPHKPWVQEALDLQHALVAYGRRIPTGDGSTQQVTEAARARPKPKRGPVI